MVSLWVVAGRKTSPNNWALTAKVSVQSQRVLHKSNVESDTSGIGSSKTQSEELDAM